MTEPYANQAAVSAAQIAAWRQDFPVFERWAYMQWPYRAALPESVRYAVGEHLLEHQLEGARARERWMQTHIDVATRIASWFGADLRDMCFVPNTTIGLSFIAQGLDWQQGDEVLIPAQEFPANVYPWMQLSERGVSVRVVQPLRPGQPVTARELVAAIGARTRLVACSHVSFHTGYCMDIEALGRDCRERGVLTVVDGAQSVGWYAYDFASLPVDALIGIGRKFLCGLAGLGFCFMKADFHRRLSVIAPGPFSVKHDRDYLRHELDLHESAWKFTGGAISTPHTVALGAALGLLAAVDKRALQQRCMSLVERFVAGLVAAGNSLPAGDWNASERSAVVSIPLPTGLDPARLEAAGCSVTLRGTAIRIGLHAWNTEAEVDRLIAVLADSASKKS